MTPPSPPGTSIAAPGELRRVRELTNAHVMGPRIQALLGRSGRVPCHVLDAKYQPGVGCTVLYRSGDLLLRGDLVDDDADPSRPVVEPGVRLSRFPDDPDLPRLRDVADPATLRAALAQALPGGGPILRSRVDLVRYRPAKRATLAVEVRRSTGPSARRAQRFVVKSYHDDRKAAAVAAEAVLLDATADPTTPLRFAPVRAHLPDLSLVVQEHVPGVALDAVVARVDGAAARALRRAATALAALHGQPVVSRRARAIGAELTRFRTRSLRVAAVDRATGVELLDLAVRLAATARDIPTGIVGLVHGDCKPSQFLLREDDVVLLDLDSCGQADPAGDVGTFVATLRQHTLRRALARRSAPAAVPAQGPLAEVFLREYVSAAGGAAGPELRRRITWYEAVAFERKALRCFARAPRAPLTRALVHQGHACLDRLGGDR